MKANKDKYEWRRRTNVIDVDWLPEKVELLQKFLYLNKVSFITRLRKSRIRNGINKCTYTHARSFVRHDDRSSLPCVFIADTFFSPGWAIISQNDILILTGSLEATQLYMCNYIPGVHSWRYRAVIFSVTAFTANRKRNITFMKLHR